MNNNYSCEKMSYVILVVVALFVVYWIRRFSRFIPARMIREWRMAVIKDCEGCKHATFRNVLSPHATTMHYDEFCGVWFEDDDGDVIHSLTRAMTSMGWSSSMAMPCQITVEFTGAEIPMRSREYSDISEFAHCVGWERLSYLVNSPSYKPYVSTTERLREFVFGER